MDNFHAIDQKCVKGLARKIIYAHHPFSTIDFRRKNQITCLNGSPYDGPPIQSRKIRPIIRFTKVRH